MIVERLQYFLDDFLNFQNRLNLDPRTPYLSPTYLKNTRNMGSLFKNTISHIQESAFMKMWKGLRTKLLKCWNLKTQNLEIGNLDAWYLENWNCGSMKSGHFKIWKLEIWEFDNWSFEVLKIEKSENSKSPTPSAYRLPPLHPTTVLGCQVFSNMWRYAGSNVVRRR